MEIATKQLLVPELRFPEFCEEWNTKSIGTICTVKTGSRDTQNKIEGGLYPFFVRSNKVERINSYSFDGEAILTSGDGVGVGKNYHYINGKFDFHQRVYALFSFLKEYDVQFTYQVFSEKFYKRVIRLSAKNSVDSVRMNMITDMKLNFPNLTEQQKIASFFSTIDEKIAQLTSKLEELKLYKKGVVQKIFSQEIRFKPAQNGVAGDENGAEFPEWEKKKLGDLATRITKKNKKVSIKQVLTNSATKGVVNQHEYFDREIANQNNLEGYYVVNLNDFVYSPRVSVNAPVGPIKRNKIGIGVMSPLYSIFRFTDNNLEFFEYYFETTNWHKYLISVANIGARHDRMNILNNDFFNMPIPYPCEAERKKITFLLNDLSHKVESLKSQLKLTKTWKKGLLQRMFV